MEGVKWVSNPCVRVKDKVVCLSDMECSHPPKEVPTLIVEEWHCTLQKTKPGLIGQYMRMCSSKRRG